MRPHGVKVCLGRSDPRINRDCGRAVIIGRGRNADEITRPIKGECLPDFARPERRVPLQRAVVTVLDVARIALGLPPPGQVPGRRNARSTFSRAPGVVDRRDIRRQQRLAEHLDFIDQAGEKSRSDIVVFAPDMDIDVGLHETLKRALFETRPKRH